MEALPERRSHWSFWKILWPTTGRISTSVTLKETMNGPSLSRWYWWWGCYSLLRADYVSDALLNTISIVSHEILTTILWGRYHSSHFPVEEPETQRTEVSCEVTQLMSGSPSLGSSSWWLSAHLHGKDQLPIRPAALPPRLLTTVLPRPALPCSGLPAPKKLLWMGTRAFELESGRPGFKAQLTTYICKVLGKLLSLFRSQFPHL